MNTPVAIVFFNRLAPLKRLVSRLAEIKPLNVYLISDGPRSQSKCEAEKVAACRDFMVNLPWSCNIKTLYKISAVINFQRSTQNAVSKFC